MFPNSNDFEIFFKSILSASKQDNKKKLFCLVFKNKFLLWAPPISPLSFLEN